MPRPGLAAGAARTIALAQFDPIEETKGESREERRIGPAAVAGGDQFPVHWIPFHDLANHQPLHAYLCRASLSGMRPFGQREPELCPSRQAGQGGLLP